MPYFTEIYKSTRVVGLRALEYKAVRYTYWIPELQQHDAILQVTVFIYPRALDIGRNRHFKFITLFE